MWPHILRKKFTQTIFPVDTIQDSQEVFWKLSRTFLKDPTLKLEYTEYTHVHLVLPGPLFRPCSKHLLSATISPIRPIDISRNQCSQNQSYFVWLATNPKCPTTNDSTVQNVSLLESDLKCLALWSLCRLPAELPLFVNNSRQNVLVLHRIEKNNEKRALKMYE